MLTSLSLSGVCSAGQYGDELGRCLVKHASEADTKVLTQWAFVTLGQTKAAREIAQISPQVTSRTTSKAQTVILRLLGKDCAKEALKATLYEGKDGIGNGIGYAIILIIVATVREILGSGTLLGFHIIPQFLYDAGYENNGLMILPPMALITVACIIWVHRSRNKDLQEKN